MKAIQKYTGLNFLEIYNLPYVLYLLYRRDSWIFNNSQSEKGREFLKTIWRLNQTECDTKAIHEFQERR